MTIPGMLSDRQLTTELRESQSPPFARNYTRSTDRGVVTELPEFNLKINATLEIYAFFGVVLVVKHF